MTPRASGISVPLFTNYYYEGEIRRAEVDLLSARDNYERVRALALGEIVARRAELDAARERVQRFEASLLKAAQSAADAAESEPCTRFSVKIVPKSPRIVPGAAERGLVVPIIARTISHVSSGPSTTSATTGLRDMNATSSA